MKQTNSQRESRKRLLNAKQILRSEYIGLDAVIDQVIDAITPWYLMPEWHNRPLVVNLWGMTGTGKTSLVNRLSELLRLNDRTFQVDLSNGFYRNIFQEIKAHRNGQQIVLVLDEFQLFRTIDEDFKETQRNRKQIWDLMDSGKYQETEFSFRLHELQSIILKMRYLLSLGMRVSNGIVKSHHNQFTELFDEPKWKDDGQPLWFFPRSQWPLLSELSSDYIIPQRWKDFAIEHTNQEQIEELERVLNVALQPQEVDCSKALIFIIGNLDEAYGVSKNMDRNLHADAFHEITKRIGVQQIKNALLSRFRPEQIARLGNIHILYPALSSINFKDIIACEFQKMIWQLAEKAGVELTINQDVTDFIYAEGVYPAQGVRPLFSTIRSALWPAISHFAFFVSKKKESKWNLSWDKENKSWLFVGGKYTFRHNYNPESDRYASDPIRDGDKKLIAVHEAGHVLGMIALQGELPDYVYNNTHNGVLSGVVMRLHRNNLKTLDTLINSASMILGGWVAEGFVFGDDGRTAGSDEDLRKATWMLLDALKTEGVDSEPYFWRGESEKGDPNRIHDNQGILDNRAKELLDIARKRMEICLDRHQLLFRNLVSAIHGEPYLKKGDIEKILADSGYKPLVSHSMRLSMERTAAYDKLMNNTQALYTNHQKETQAA